MKRESMIDVHDELVDEELQKKIYDYVKGLEYNGVEVDLTDTHLSQGHSHDFDFKDPLMVELEECFKHLIPENNEPHRWYCNHIMSNEIPQSHYDSQYETDTTILYYANVDYNHDWGGETVFYDESKELIKAVMPKPGRISIFPANVLHSARPFALYVQEPRFTVAFKYMFSI